MAIGPVEGAIRYHAANEDQIAAVRAAVHDMAKTFNSADGLRIPGEINFVTATVA